MYQYSSAYSRTCSTAKSGAAIEKLKAHTKMHPYFVSRIATYLVIAITSAGTEHVMIYVMMRVVMVIIEVI